MVNRSSYPNSNDTFTELSDTLSSDKANVDRYKQLVTQSTRTSAEETELTNLKNLLKNKIVSSDSINKLQDSTTNLQSFIGLSANLSTSNKTSIVAAVNEVQSELDNHSANTNDPHQSLAQAKTWVQGYGLGDVVKDVSSTNLNSLDGTGFYKGSNLTNAPQSNVNYTWEITHTKLSTTGATQMATLVTDQNANLFNGYVYFRQKAGGVWSSWTQVWTYATLPDTEIHRKRWDVANTEDWNAINQNGTFRIYDAGTSHSSFPSGGYTYGTLSVFANGNSIAQMYFEHGSIGAVWFRDKYNASDWTPWRKMYSNGSGVQKGTASLSLSNEAFKSITVTFPTPFKTAPTVVATPSGQTTYLASVSSVTATNFQLWVRYYSGSNITESVSVNWIAME